MARGLRFSNSTPGFISLIDVFVKTYRYGFGSLNTPPFSNRIEEFLLYASEVTKSVTEC